METKTEQQKTPSYQELVTICDEAVKMANEWKESYKKLDSEHKRLKSEYNYKCERVTKLEGERDAYFETIDRLIDKLKED